MITISNKCVLIVSAVFPPEPVVSANMSFDIAYKLSNNYDVIVLSPQPTRPLGKIFNSKSSSYSFQHIILDSYTCPQSCPIGRFRESWSFGKATSQYIVKNKDKIGVIYASTWPLFAQKMLCRVANKYNIPVIMHIQDIYPDSFSRKLPKILSEVFQTLFLPIDKYVLKHSINVIGISNSMISYLSKSRGISKDMFTLVRNWQNDSMFINQYKPICSNGREKKFLFLGSINPTASVETIILAFAKANLQNATLSIIGTGSNREHCEKIVSDLSLKVNFNQVDAKDVSLVQSNADILLLPLKKGIAYTATPSKLTAYLLSGRPIIAALEKDSDAGRIISESKCGVLTPAEDINAIAEAMINLNNMDDSQLNKMGIRGFEYAKQYLSKEHNLQILCDVIEKHYVM